MIQILLNKILAQCGAINRRTPLTTQLNINSIYYLFYHNFVDCLQFISLKFLLKTIPFPWAIVIFAYRTKAILLLPFSASNPLSNQHVLPNSIGLRNLNKLLSLSFLKKQFNIIKKEYLLFVCKNCNTLYHC